VLEYPVGVTWTTQQPECPVLFQNKSCDVATPCPVDCIIIDIQWGQCTALPPLPAVQCGGVGLQHPNISFTEPRYGGIPCQIPVSRQCNLPTCQPTLQPTPLPTELNIPALELACDTPNPIAVEEDEAINTASLSCEEVIIEARNPTSGVGYSDPGATCTDTSPTTDSYSNFNITTDPSVTSSYPDVSTPGSYPIEYSCTNPRTGAIARPVTRIVRVTDTRCPICSVGAEYPLTTYHEASFPFNGRSAGTAIYCWDPRSWPEINSSGPTSGVDLPLSVFIDGHVNVEKPGTYRLTYSAVDAEGNWNYECASQLSNAIVRTVIVTDTLKPVITLHGQESSASVDTRRLLTGRTEDIKYSTYYARIPLGICAKLLLIFTFISVIGRYHSKLRHRNDKLTYDTGEITENTIELVKV